MKKKVAGLIGVLLVVIAFWVSSCKGKSVSTAEALADPIACALLVANRLDSQSEDLLSQIAVAFAKAGDCTRAFRLAASFREKEWFRARSYLVSPKAIALGDIAVICTRGGNPDIAEKAYTAALQVLAENGFERHPLWEAYNSLALNQAELGNVGEAIRLVAEHSKLVEKEEPDSIRTRRVDGWTDVAKKLAAIGNKIDASSVVRMSVDGAAEIEDVGLRASALVKAAELYLTLGETKQGIELLKKALALASRPGESAYRDEEKQNVANVFLRAGDFKSAEDVIALLELEYKRSWAWRDFAVKAAETGDCRLALQVSERISGFDDKATALKAIVKQYADRGEIQKAAEVCERIKGFGNRADARLLLAQGFVGTLALVDARKFVELALDDAGKESSGSDYSLWQRHLRAALLLNNIGEKSRAIAIIKDIGQREGSSSVLEEAGLIAVTEGNYDLAIEISTHITKDTYIEHAGTIPKGLHRAGVLVDGLLKHAEAKRKGLDQEKNVQQAVLKTLGFIP